MHVTGFWFFEKIQVMLSVVICYSPKAKNVGHKKIDRAIDGLILTACQSIKVYLMPLYYTFIFTFFVSFFKVFAHDIRYSYIISIWPIDETLPSTTTPGQGGPGSNGSKWVLHTP